jgi:hypothetical protein
MTHFETPLPGNLIKSIRHAVLYKHRKRENIRVHGMTAQTPSNMGFATFGSRTPVHLVASKPLSVSHSVKRVGQREAAVGFASGLYPKPCPALAKICISAFTPAALYLR